eukprot:PhF_6_TR8309/c1_g3_i2/m.12864
MGCCHSHNADIPSSTPKSTNIKDLDEFYPAFSPTSASSSSHRPRSVLEPPAPSQPQPLSTSDNGYDIGDEPEDMYATSMPLSLSKLDDSLNNGFDPNESVRYLNTAAMEKVLLQQTSQNTNATTLVVSKDLNGPVEASGLSDSDIQHRFVSVLGKIRSVASDLVSSSDCGIETHQIYSTQELIRGFDDQGNKLLNEYAVIGKLGQGSFGKVKLAIDTNTDLPVAIKILNKRALTRMSLPSTRENSRV